MTISVLVHVCVCMCVCVCVCMCVCVCVSYECQRRTIKKQLSYHCVDPGNSSQVMQLCEPFCLFVLCVHYSQLNCPADFLHNLGLLKVFTKYYFHQKSAKFWNT